MWVKKVKLNFWRSAVEAGTIVLVSLTTSPLTGLSLNCLHSKQFQNSFTNFFKSLPFLSRVTFVNWKNISFVYKAFHFMRILIILTQVERHIHQQHPIGLISKIFAHRGNAGENLCSQMKANWLRSSCCWQNILQHHITGSNQNFNDKWWYW